jgi:hypothetical protein
MNARYDGVATWAKSHSTIRSEPISLDKLSLSRRVECRMAVQSQAVSSEIRAPYLQARCVGSPQEARFLLNAQNMLEIKKSLRFFFAANAPRQELPSALHLAFRMRWIPLKKHHSLRKHERMTREAAAALPRAGRSAS